MPKQNAPTPEPFLLGHSALGGFTVGPEALAVQQAGGLVQGEQVDHAEPLRPIDPKAGGPEHLKPGTKIE